MNMNVRPPIQGGHTGATPSETEKELNPVSRVQQDVTDKTATVMGKTKEAQERTGPKKVNSEIVKNVNGVTGHQQPETEQVRGQLEKTNSFLKQTLSNYLSLSNVFSSSNSLLWISNRLLSKSAAYFLKTSNKESTENEGVGSGGLNPTDLRSSLEKAISAFQEESDKLFSAGATSSEGHRAIEVYRELLPKIEERLAESIKIREEIERFNKTGNSSNKTSMDKNENLFQEADKHVKEVEGFKTYCEDMISAKEKELELDSLKQKLEALEAEEGLLMKEESPLADKLNDLTSRIESIKKEMELKGKEVLEIKKFLDG